MGSSSNNTAIFLKGFQLAVGVMILQIAGFLLVPNVCPATTPTSLAPTKKKKREGPPSTTTTATPHHVSSWSFKFKKLVTCMFDGGKAQEILNPTVVISKGSLQRRSWIDCSGSGLCNIRDVAHGNTRVMHRSETEISSVVVHDDESGSCTRTRTRTLTLTQDDHSNHPVGGSSSLRFSRGMHLTRWSGCYECRMIVDPIQALSTFPATIFACSSCGQIFTNSDALEQHQAIKHAVSELGEEDSARTVVDIIFQSSWLKKENPVCKIERILKIHNSQKSINKFEEYRDMVKAKANKVAKKHPRCIADGNELLRFHCTTLACSLGMNGCCSLCNQPSCTMCNVITHGFSSPPPTEEILEGKGKGKGNASGIGIYTTASSGKAHDHIQLLLEEENDQELLTSKVAKGKRKRAMLVCRVIAGRVQKSQDPDDFIAGGFDSIAGETGLYSNLEELFVYNPRAVLPCFVVIYHTDCPHLTHTTPHSTALTASIFYKQK